MRRTTRLSLFATLLFVCISTLSFAQPRSFTAEPQAYFDELSEMLTDMDDVDSDTVEAVLLAFKTTWTNIDENVRPRVYGISDIFLRKRIRTYDDWKNFIDILTHFHEYEDPAQFLAWMEHAEEHFRRESGRGIQEYLYNLATAFQPEVIYKARDITWSSVGEGEFLFDGKPYIIYDIIDLWGHYGADSTLIESTSGKFDILGEKFEGTGGNVYWTRAGLSEDTIYAELSTYTIQLDRPTYTADSVRLHSKLYVTQPILGSFEERMSVQVQADFTSYPQFSSYERVTISDFVPGVDYVGGFSVKGKRFFASEQLPRLALLRFKKEGEYFIDLRAEQFSLSTTDIRSDACQVSIKMGENDSIYHPKSSMSYNTENITLKLTRDGEGLSATPYIDSYHNLDMYLEQIEWVTNNPQFFIQNLAMGEDQSMVFESQEYYRQERFDALTGLANKNPLYDLRRIALSRDTADLPLETIAGMLRMNQISAERFLLNMSIGGFVSYNLNTKVVTFNEKLFNYIYNNERKRDYDVIRFVSQVGSGANARVSLLNYDLEITGIRAIALSDSQEVALFPSQRRITVHEGLDFDFDGVVQAGRFTYFAQNNFFDYDMFRISMPDIDSMKFKVEEFDDGHRPPGVQPRLVAVKNTLQDINGELLIDKPFNKSGKVPFHDYPIFKSGTGSYVYYDRPSIYGGVYEREDFYVELEPFEIDSLDNARTEGLKFAGVFVSAGIFPDMPQDIKVQEDYSLGFKASTPPTGLPAYGGKGTFTNDLQLSNEGLVGTGTIDYITSTAKGEAFTFFPDSTNGIADTYVAEPRLAGAVNTPRAVNENVDINWRPYQDVMFATSRTSPFRMYEEIGMEAEGTIAYGASDMRGNAVLDFLDAQTKSKDFQFYNQSFEAASMNFKVKARPEGDWAFKLRDARGTVDFQKMDGDFTLNDGESYMEFSTNQYITWMDHADWDITAKTIDVNHVDGSLSRMLSVHPQQDSLEFDAKTAKFSLLPSLLETFEVPHMDVADSRLFPDSGYVAIDSAADMHRLEKSKLTANRYTQHHNFYNGSFKVRGKNNYSGNAEYEYLDEDGTSWPLYFETIRADRDGTTVGYADVSVEDGFYLSSFFGYHGKVELNAPERLLNYDGYVLIQHTCDNLETDWFKFESKIDPKNIVIDLPEDNPNTITDNIYSGIYLAPDSTSIYTGFLNKDASRVDKELIAATGVLFYDKGINSYVITTKRRLQDETKPDNYLAFNNRDCIMTGKGQITLAQDLGRVKMETFGIIEHDLRSDELTMDVTMAFDFYFSEDVMAALAEDVNAETSLSGSRVNREAYRIGMDYQFDDEEDKEEYFEEVANMGAPEDIPKPLRNTIYITDLELKWDEDQSAFVSTDDIGIGHFGEVQVNKRIEGLMEIRHRRRNAEIYLYLEPNRDYYYFQYMRNNMQFFTTKRETLNSILQIEPEDRALERDGDLPRYSFNQSSRGRVNLFLRRHGMAE